MKALHGVKSDASTARAEWTAHDQLGDPR